MSPAPSLDALLDFETEWDRALAAALTALPTPFHVTHAAGELKPPYGTAYFEFRGEHPLPGGANPLQRGAAGASAGATFDGASFVGRAVIELVSDRRAPEPARVQLTRGGLRRLFLPSTGTFRNRDILPWYSIASVAFGEGARTIDDDRDLDITTLTFDLVWGILPEAWPA